MIATTARFAAAVACAILCGGGAASAGGTLTVVELFTSQGCSRCPPADALLGELATRPDVLALSEHVDYWDYLGWRDPLALSGNRQRQREYARQLGIQYVYTPQMIIQGSTQVIASDRAAVLQRLAERAPVASPSLDITTARDGGRQLSIGSGEASDASDVLLIRFDGEVRTQVTAGENTGREVRNVNVVRALQPLGNWTGQPLTLPLPRGNDERGCAVLLQEKTTGRILAATRC